MDATVLCHRKRLRLLMMHLIRKLAQEQNITSIIAIYDLNFAVLFSDRVIILHNGTVFTNAMPFEVFTADNVREAFNVETTIDTYLN